MTSADAFSQYTTRVSVDSSGIEGNSDSYYPSISSDGRYIAFESDADNLVAGDTNGAYDIFVHDRQTGQTTRVSADSSGNQGNNGSYEPSISSDGRYVAFDSLADNLVTGDTNSASDIFVHDRQTGQTTRVSVDSSGNEGNDYSFEPSISSDGRYVVFGSFADNLVAGDTNGVYDIFVHDRQTGQTTRVSVDSSGNQGNNDSFHGSSISSDGRYVAFASDADNLVAGDTNSLCDIFVHDRQTGQTTRLSVSSSGNQGNNLSYDPSISSDGRYVAFGSLASNLVKGDTNGWWDVFVHDRQAGKTTRVSVRSSGKEGNKSSGASSISPDGRYVAFSSGATNLVRGDTNNVNDVFVHDRQTGKTTRVSMNSSGKQGNDHSSSPSISLFGRYVAFDSLASNLVADDTNSKKDIFVHYPPVILLVPNGGEVIPSGSTYTIQWTATPDALSFRVKYHDGQGWNPIASEIKDTSYDWPVPIPKKNMNKCLVKVTGFDGSDAKVGADKSDAPFTIAVVKVTLPNGGETLTSGIPYTVEWETYGTKKPVEKVVLKYTKNGGKKWKKIETLTENTGTYEWMVPGVPKTKSKCLVKVVLKDAKGNTVGSDTSDKYFTIEP